MTLRSVSSD